MKGFSFRAAAVGMLMGVSIAVAAPVSWTGLGDGVSWNQGANWSGGFVPGPADDVTINVPASDPEIVITGADASVNSLTTSEILRVTLGRTLTVATTAQSTAPVRLAAGYLTGGAWTLTGAGVIDCVASNESRILNAAINGDIQLSNSSARVWIRGTTTFNTLRMLSSSNSAAFDPGYTLHGDIIAAGSGSAFVEIVGNGTLDIGAAGSITTAAPFTSALTIGSPFWFSGNMTLNNGGLISNDAPSASSGISITPVAFANLAGGTVRCSGPGSVTIEERSGGNDSWQNSGVLSVSAGALRLRDAWSNSATGTIAVSGTGELDLGGSFTTAGLRLAGLTRTGGAIAVTGAWDNSASTVTFNNTIGSWLLRGGSITGGTLAVADGQRLLFSNTNGNSLVGVAYGDEIILEGSSQRVALGAGTTVTAVRLRGSGVSVALAPNSTLAFPIIADGTASGTRYVEVATPGNLTIGAGGSITTEGTFQGSLSVGGGFWYSAAQTLTNQSTMSVTGTSRTLTVGSQTFVNQVGATLSADGNTTINFGSATTTTNAGAINASNGATVAMRNAWSSTGTISVNNATLELGGSFNSASAATVSRSGGVINITGAWDNASTTFTLDSARGSWVLLGGSITGGTLDATGAGRLIVGAANGNRLENLALLDEVVLDSVSARTVIAGTTTMPSLRIRGTSASVGFAGGYTITYPVLFDATVGNSMFIENATAGSTFTLGAGASISTTPGNAGTPNIGDSFWYSNGGFVNNGTIEMSTAGRTMRIAHGSSSTFQNGGIVRVLAGAADVRKLTGSVSGLSISGAGSALTLDGTNYVLAGSLVVGPGTTVSLNGSWSNSGAIAIDAGTLNLGGTFSLATLGNFTNINGGVVNITGILNNTGNTLVLSNATGSFGLLGGTIVGGVINQTQNARLLFSANNANTLDGVTLGGDLVLDGTNHRVRLLGAAGASGYRLNASGTSIAFPPGFVLNSTLIAEGPIGTRNIEISGPGRLTIGPAGILRTTGSGIGLSIAPFWFNQLMELEVQGLIDHASTVASLTVDPDTLVNFDAGTGTLAGGRWRFGPSSGVTFGSRVVRRLNADVEFFGTGAATGFGSLEANLGSLWINGDRTFAVAPGGNDPASFTNSGSIRLGPGAQLAVNGIGDSYVQTAAGVLFTEIAGENVNTDYGTLRVNNGGAIALDGTFRAEFVNGFERACGQTFDVIVGTGSRTGIFADAILPPRNDENIVLLFLAGPVARLTVSSVADFNQDGFLDFFDFDDFVACFEGFACPPGVEADFNQDGFVDFFDYDDFVFRFEAGC